MGLGAQPDTCTGCSRTFLTRADNLRQQREQALIPDHPLCTLFDFSFYHLLHPICQGGNGKLREVQGLSPSHSALEQGGLMPRSSWVQRDTLHTTHTLTHRHTLTHACSHVHRHAHHTCPHMHTHPHVHAHTHPGTHMHAHMHVYTHTTRVHTCTPTPTVHAHTHSGTPLTLTRTHTYTHVHRCTLTCMHTLTLLPCSYYHTHAHTHTHRGERAQQARSRVPGACTWVWGPGSQSCLSPAPWSPQPAVLEDGGGAATPEPAVPGPPRAPCLPGLPVDLGLADELEVVLLSLGGLEDHVKMQHF